MCTLRLLRQGWGPGQALHVCPSPIQLKGLMGRRSGWSLVLGLGLAVTLVSIVREYPHLRAGRSWPALLEAAHTMMFGRSPSLHRQHFTGRVLCNDGYRGCHGLSCLLLQLPSSILSLREDHSASSCSPSSAHEGHELRAADADTYNT